MSYTKFRQANDKVTFARKNVLVVGGTSGIGAAVAIRFAELGANVIIAGRNKDAADKVMDKMTAVGYEKGNTFSFVPVDVSLIADVKRFAAEFKPIDHKLHVLILSAGGIGGGPRKETKEGLEKNFAINCSGRFLLINLLLPSLQAGGGRVLDILAAGKGAPIDVDDLELKRDYSTSKSMARNALFNDVLVKELAVRYPDVAFHHLFPGLVKTDVLTNSNLPSCVFCALGAIYAIGGTSPEKYAEAVVYASWDSKFGTEHSGRLVGPKLQDVKPVPFASDKNAIDRIWTYSINVTGMKS
mmetsp:Transcript_55630/g.92407  ORF Transcript_55630/g.92407 Transcript_55630/m.92407 type:complete len:299 (-) Transcript_55630:104-1000(-)